MKKTVLLLSIWLIMAGGKLFAQAGNLDNSYGTGGSTSALVGTGGGEVWGMAMQSDWSVVVGGYAISGGDSNFALMHITSDGAIDSSFGTNGLAMTTMGTGSSLIHSVALQPDGKIVAAGFAWNNAKYNFALARYNTNGSLDNSFGSNGKVITSIGPGNSQGVSLMLESDWTIVVGGSSFNGTNDVYTLTKYKTNGTLDSAFGTNGIVLAPIGGGDGELGAIGFLSDSSILASGTVVNGVYSNFALVKYSKTGVVDSSFGTNGRVITTGGDNDDQAVTMALQGDGKILVGGYSGKNNIDNFAVMRYQSNGSLDNGFGTSGKVTSTVGDSSQVYALLIQPDEKILAVGSCMTGGEHHYAMTRYTTNGTTDNDFGTNGIVNQAITTGNSEAYAVAMQSDGKIVASGYSTTGSQESFCVVRYLSGLTLGILDFKKENNNVFIYPNPVAENAVLEYALSKTEQVSIRLLDMDGKTIATLLNNTTQGAGQYQQPILLPEGLASGAYLINISSPEGQMSVKIIK